MSTSPRPHRGRFAPSPTGRLHLGNVRSALLGWLWARSEEGEFLVRMEDLDRARSKEAYVESQLADLAYLGLTHEGPVLLQSQRQAVYDAALADLAARDLVYPCFCTRTEIARAASAPHGASDEGPRYPGTCAQLDAAQRAERARGRAPALRFRAQPGVVEVEDVLQGRYLQDVQEVVGDFVVRRNDGVASYQLAVVVDDAASGVTHVLRGDDLLPSTPRQLQLHAALGLPPPVYAHVGLVLGADGKRLAKREGPSAVADLRAAGVPATRVLGLLARWSGLGEGRPVAAEDLVLGFSLERLAANERSRSVVTTDLELQELLKDPVSD